MRNIILASQSKQRQKLLRQIGLRFVSARSDVKEDMRLKSGCADLVMDNALKKAKDVAKRYRSGIVIAADTVVLSGKKIIGKPKNLGDAFRTLKLISRRPQWVYTGMAVIDIDNKKVLTDYEKTKIYMYRLSDRQIRNYFRKVSPLDKAGSFDIQGLGSVFINRIEGCFNNVIGLPLAKLAKMLKKIDIDLFA
ncbi:MAG: Maf family protein [Candidatus Omnitrophica bacterium]|nr:Maf family protein [Candidatus Omnitrophota bacterium]MDD5311166.1 Maf family protein [Candidatus Omnitrophota bacterium]MDD5547192.1 Maf family protein [Candidatus Omnitrophota bacterium]